MVLNSIMKNFKQSGFTIIELMVVIAMMGVVSAVAIPSFRAMLITNEVVDTTNQMQMSLKLARSEAIVNGKDAFVCSSKDGATCSNADGNWNKGWLVYVDLNGNSTMDVNELRWVHEINSGSQVTIVPTAAAFNQQVQFSYNGWLTDGDELGFDICSGYAANGYPQRQIRASLAGEASLFKNVSVKC